MERFRAIFYRLGQAWVSVQVEFHGHFSNKRLRRLGSYLKNLSHARILLVCLLTALPCLVIGLLTEALPLATPEDGVIANWVFWVRFWVVGYFLVVCTVTQMSQYVPRIEVKPHQVLIVGFLSSTVASSAVFVIALTTIFPVPFSTVVASAIAIAMFICFTYFWGDQWRADESLQKEIKRQLNVFMYNMSLTLVYPIYIFGFVSVSGVSQALFAMMLPTIKLIGRNVLSYILDDHNDVKPEVVVFNVEVFNALYVATALQSVLSYTATATIMIIDLVQFWLMSCKLSTT